MNKFCLHDIDGHVEKLQHVKNKLILFQMVKRFINTFAEPRNKQHLLTLFDCWRGGK